MVNEELELERALDFKINKWGFDLPNKKTFGGKKYMKKAKPSRVIYVVCRPRPGQSRGDWAVRMHGKILSQHKLKSVAVKRARVEARKRSGFSVLVQNMNGSMGYGFTPKRR